MVPHVTDQQVTRRLVHDQADIAADAHRGKVGILGMVELVKTQAGAGRVDLQIKNGGLDRFLILVGQLCQAVYKGVCDAEFHQSHLEDFHDFIAQMVDHLDRNATGGGLIEGTRGIAMQRFPGFFVDLGFEGGLEARIGIIGAQEIGMPDEEALFVIVGIDEPAGNAFGAVTAHLAGIGMEDIHPVDLDLDLPIFGIQDGNIRLAEDDEQVALAGVLQIIGHMQIGIHAGLEHRDGAQLAEFGGLGIIIESTGDQHIEPGIPSFTRRRHQVGTGDRAELRPDEDARPLLAASFFAALEVTPFSANVIARPGSE